MIAAFAAFADPLSPAPVAYGSLSDFARFRGDRSGAEICDACSTLNSCHASFCKGCAGKLPAYYATTVHGEAEAPAHRRDRGARFVALRARGFVLAMLWVLPMILMVLAAFGLWLTGPSTAGTLVSEHARAPVVGDVPPAQPAQPQPRIELTQAEAGASFDRIGTLESPVPRSAQNEAGPKSPRAFAPMRARAAASVLVRGAARGPQARCDGLNFFSHAICMNNACAQPVAGRSAQCVEARHQRRLDEARRDPTLLG